jgi:phosphoribosylformylglycinamidine synthase
MDVVLGKREGAPPPEDLAAERTTGDLVRALIRNGSVSAVHDISDGGLLIAVAEMALAGGIGVSFDEYESPLPLHALAFGEDQGRYIVATSDKSAILLQAAGKGIPVRIIGETKGDEITMPGEKPIKLQHLKDLHEGWLPHYMTSR